MRKAKQDSPEVKADEVVKDKLPNQTTVETADKVDEVVGDINDSSIAEELEAKQDSPEVKADEGDAVIIASNTTYVSVELAIEHLAATESELVKVQIAYPADWSKSKFFLDGEIKEVHRNNAEIFIKQGIATLVTE